MAVFLFTTVARRDPGRQDHCTSKTVASDSLRKAYAIVVACIACLVALGVSLYGTIISIWIRVCHTVGCNLSHDLQGHSQASSHVAKFLLLVITSGLAMVVQSGLQVYNAFTSNLTSLGAFVALLFVEVTPGFALLFVLRQPRNLEGFKDLMWCCYLREIENQVSTPKTGSKDSSGSNRGAAISGTDQIRV